MGSAFALGNIIAGSHNMTRRATQRALIAAVGVVCVIAGIRAGATDLGAVFGGVGMLTLIVLFITRRSAT